MNFDEYRTFDATGLAELVAGAQVTAAELLEVARARAEAVNPRISAIVRDVPAAPADAAAGPFAGVPFLIKDLGQDYAGLPTSRGSRALKSAESLRGSAVQGVVSRKVRDTAAMLDVISGGEPGGLFAPKLPECSFASAVGADPGKLRIGVRVPSAINPNPHREAYAAVEATVQTLTDLGHHVDELPQARSTTRRWRVNSCCRGSSTPRGNSTRPSGSRARVTTGSSATPSSWPRSAERPAASPTPTLATPPPRIGEFDLAALLKHGSDVLLKTRATGLLRFTKILDDSVETNLAWVPYAQLANITGRPAITMPLHWTADGLPLGVQFVAPLEGESLLIRLAAQLEEAMPWKDRVAPV